MAKYINIETSEYPLTERLIRKANPNVSFPRPFRAPGYEPVLATPKPETSVIQRAVETAPVESGGKYYQSWKVEDIYSDTETATKEEQEAAAIAAETARQQEALKSECERAIERLIQSEVDKYNKTNQLVFADVHNCANYAQVDGYAHQAFCSAVWSWNVAVWEAARQALADAMAGTITITSFDDLSPLLPEFTFSQ